MDEQRVRWGEPEPAVQRRWRGQGEGRLDLGRGRVCRPSHSLQQASPTGAEGLDAPSTCGSTAAHARRHNCCCRGILAVSSIAAVYLHARLAPPAIWSVAALDRRRPRRESAPAWPSRAARDLFAKSGVEGLGPLRHPASSPLTRPPPAALLIAHPEASPLSSTTVAKSLLHPKAAVRPARTTSANLSSPDRALFVKNLSFNVTPEELFDLFGKFGPVRYVDPLCALAHSRLPICFALLMSRSQIRQGIANNTKGTAFVVYEDVMDAKSACDKLNGFNFQNRYLVVLYHQPDKMIKAANDLAERQENLEKLKKQHGID
ncbi:Nn.00g111130.m01.CDS01 [Neocucurbitaria sp. VM-36]